MRATPPPRGVALKKAMLLSCPVTDLTNVSVIRFVSGLTSSMYC